MYLYVIGVELTVQGLGWTEQNQGRLYLHPDEFINDLLLIVKVYPKNAPFESCHIVKGEPYDPAKITNSFFPENTEVDMHAFDNTFAMANLYSLRYASSC